MGSLALAAWMLLHPFAGVTHDAVLYSLFALARLHPDTLTADVFLRLGSQDSFSLFTPIYATAMRWFGMEHAARILLALCQAALLGGVWGLARRFMPPLDATLSVALLLALPSEYGMGDTFHFLDDCITARIPAEALVVGAVLAAVTRRYAVAAGCAIAAMLLHPIMGAAGIAFLVFTCLVPRYPRATLAVIGVGFMATVATVVASAPLGRIEDKDWLFAIYSSSSYLFVTLWSLFDWSRAAVYLVILTVGCWICPTPRLRQVCMGLLATAACGVVISVVFGDLFHVSIFIAMQAWRWLWLTQMLAITLAPAILQACWGRGYAGRAAVVFCGTAWIFRDLPLDGLLDAMVIACAAVPSQWNGNRYWRLLFVGACVLSGLAVSLDISNAFGYTPRPVSFSSTLLQQVRGACVDGAIPGVILIASWMILRRSVSNVTGTRLASAAALTCASVALLLCGWLLPFTWANCTDAYYTPERADLFAPWRAVIPLTAEVVWLENPVGTWFLLDRPSYTSADQIAGAIFSKEKALLVRRRMSAETAVLRASSPISTDGLRSNPDTTLSPLKVLPLTLEGMRALCTDPDLGYVVNWSAPVPTPFPPVTVDSTRENGKLYLYRCTNLRS